MNYEYKVGSETVRLEPDFDFVAIRFQEPAPMSMRASIAREVGDFTQRLEVPDEKYTVIPVAQLRESRPARFHSAVSGLIGREEVARTAAVFKQGSNHVLATDRVLVGLDKPSQELLTAAQEKGWTIDSSGKYRNVVRLNPEEDPFEAAATISALAGIRYAEPDFVTIGPYLPRTRAVTAPTGPSVDPLVSGQYALRVTRALEALGLQKGASSIKIAVLDEGVDSAHEDLREAVVGHFDATDNDSFQEPKPRDAHGTCCAGLAAATGGNGRGIVGAGSGCSILAVRIAFSDDRDPRRWRVSNEDIASGIDWAWENGADILSNSWGGGPQSNAINEAFMRARTEGRVKVDPFV